MYIIDTSSAKKWRNARNLLWEREYEYYETYETLEEAKSAANEHESVGRAVVVIQYAGSYTVFIREAML